MSTMTIIAGATRNRITSLNRNAWFVVILLLMPKCESLRLSNMTAPLIQDPREDMRLFCEFDMEGEELYAVKWYKDDHEFFRYSPAGNNRLLNFQVTGVHVNPSKVKCTMTSCSLVLDDLSRTFSSGAYRCEVSTEAPTFRLASQTHNITVAVIPKKNPTLEGIKDHYLVGDLLVATCSSELGDPKPIISWYINRHPVNNRSIKELSQRPGSFYHEHDKIQLKSTTIQLRLPLDKNMIGKKQSTTIEVTCVQSTDISSSNILLSRNTTKIVHIMTEEELVNNQKLYGIFDSSGWKIHPNVIFVAMFSIVCLY